MDFSIKSCVRFGWDTFWKRPWFFGLVFLVIGILSGNYGYQTSSTDFRITPELVMLLIVAGVVGTVIHTLVGMGRTNLLLKAHDNAGAVSWRDLWSPSPFWKYFLTSLAYGLIVVAGFILLIVPGIIWSIKYMFAPYLVMDRTLGVREALRESARITSWRKWDLFLLGLVLGLINILGLLCLVIGLLVTVPVTYLAVAHAYRILEHTAGEMTPAAA